MREHFGRTNMACAIACAVVVAASAAEAREHAVRGGSHLHSFYVYVTTPAETFALAAAADPACEYAECAATATIPVLRYRNTEVAGVGMLHNLLTDSELVAVPVAPVGNRARVVQAYPNSEMTTTLDVGDLLEVQWYDDEPFTIGVFINGRIIVTLGGHQ